MKRHGVTALLGMMILFCIWLVPSSLNALDHDRPHLLVLNSYHPGLPWSQGLMRGLVSVFDDSGLPLVVHVEYLDGIRYPQDGIFPLMKEYLERKYEGIPLRVILATDDVALDFLFLYRDELFPGVPIVFSGPNDFSPQRLSIHTQITGIAENPDMRGTIDLVRTLHPDAPTIAVVADRNPASLRVIQGLMEIEGELGLQGLFTVLTDAGLEELLAEFQALPPGTPVVFHAFLRDAAGRTYPSNLQNLALLSGQSGLPFYTFKKIDIGHGAVGGAVISEELMAEIAAGMAVQVLQGVPVQSIPPLYDTPQVYLFDFEQLHKFGIKPDMLPDSAVILNRPFSLYHGHKKAFHAAGAGLILLMGLLAALVIRNRREHQERRRAEQELRESEEKLHALFSTMNEMVVLHDLVFDAQGNPVDYRILDCNPAFYRVTGLKEGTVVGKTATQVYQTEDAPFLDVFSSVAVSGKSTEFSTYYAPMDKHFFISVVCPRKNTFATITSDISEQVRSETEREKLQSQLLQAQKMESVGILAGGVAHDFNNLLHMIRGNIELLARNPTIEPQGSARLESVFTSLDRAARLVQQLLLFSRKAEPGKERVDLNQEVREAVRMLERTIPKMVALELHLDPDIWPISGDPVQIEQVLLNMANNSVDAMPEGGRLVIETGNVELDADFVRLHPGASTGPHVLLTVSDTGCGMDAMTRKHVFDPFFTTKEVGQGTGLGLASAYGIVTAYGGYIQCYSESGQGTTFRIYLPAAEGGETGAKGPRSVANVPNTEISNDQGGQTILVVDDELTIRELTQEALEDFGYVVLSAANGEEALNIYQEHGQAIDLVLLDLNMPGMGGHKCLQQLLLLDPSVQVLIASGYSVNGQAGESLKSGAAGFIGKPYQLKELQAAVREAMGRE
jgi:signal transduction histidine kinase/ActR/RegA family two-component response regulator